VAETPRNLPDFVNWPSFPFTGDMRVKPLLPPAAKEPPRQGETEGSCHACVAPDEAYIWVSERWRVRAMERPTGLPMVLILESRSHLDLGDLPNLLAAELGVMTVRLERAIRSLDGVARVHVNRWGDGSAHLHLWFLARPFGYLQLRGSFLSLWDDILPPIAEETWRENLAMIAAWLAEFGGRPLAEPPRIDWQAPASVAAVQAAQSAAGVTAGLPTDSSATTAEQQPVVPAPAAEASAQPATAAPESGPSAGSSEPASSESRSTETPADPAAENAPTTEGVSPAEAGSATEGMSPPDTAAAQSAGSAEEEAAQGKAVLAAE
jgi:hypothetical protein